MAFDDSYHHTIANNHPNQSRVVLDVSFWNPRLRPYLFPPLAHPCCECDAHVVLSDPW
jgi:hypothetical protein